MTYTSGGTTPLQQMLVTLIRGSGVPQIALSKTTGYSQKHISQMMNGLNEGTLTAWQTLLDAAGVTVAGIGTR